MTPTERISDLVSEHPAHEQLILLSALSVLWLRPEHPDAKTFLQRYQSQSYSLDALREAALQLFLLAGFQTSLEAMFQIKDVFGTGLAPLENELNAMHASEWLERGRELQAQVYRENTGKLRENLDAASPELSVWTVLIGYGLVMSRPGLPEHYRELLEVVVLAVQDFPRQLHSHLRGALNLGASVEEVELVLHVADIFASSDQSRSAWQMWRHVK